MKQTFKKYFKGSPKKVETQEPRKLDEIQKEYVDLCSRVGQTQYRMKVLENDVNTLFSRIAEIDHEAGARRKLDEEANKTQQTPEVKNEQV